MQQDNASAHISDDDEDLVQASDRERTSVKVFSQPENSPYPNVNDLRFFRAIHS